MMAKRTMATVQSRIGDKKVEMSNLETGRFINYQRIEDTLQVVRSRYVVSLGPLGFACLFRKVG
jgi:aconitate hydratase